MIPFPPFEPDKSPFNGGAGDNLKNCLPVADGWGPMPDFVELSDALPDDCVGLTAYKAPDGTLTVIAGTSTNLYKLDTTTDPYSWTNVSLLADGYSVPANDRWSFAVFGDYLIACQLGDPPQFISLSSGTAFANLAGSPPTAKYVATVGDFLVLYNLDGAPSRLQWSGLNNAEWWTAGQRNSDIQEFPDGGEIQALSRVGLGAIVIQRDGMKNMVFTGDTNVFAFSDANAARGSVSGESVVQIGPGRFLYLSEQGYFSGVEGTPIGAERVDDWFFQNIDLDFLPEVLGFADPYNKIAWWKFTTSDASTLLIGYAWQLDRWCYSDQNFQAGGAIATPGITLEGLDNLYASLDAIPVSLDSRIFKGGRPVFAIINTDRKLAFFGATAKAATLETGEIELVPGSRAWVNGGRAITDATGFTVTMKVSDYHGAAQTSKAAVSPSTRSGHLPLRGAGRLFSFQIDIPAATAWTVTTGIDVKAVREGDQ